jgi:hypothetical protein
MLRPLRPRGEVMRGEERRGEEMRSKGDGWIFVSICKCKYFIFKQEFIHSMLLMVITHYHVFNDIVRIEDTGERYIRDFNLL